MNTLKGIFRASLAGLLISSAMRPVGLMAAYDDVGVGARVTGLGNAFTGVADDVYAVYYNPAGLATLGRPEFSTSYSKLLTGLSDNSNLQNSFLAYAHPLKDGRWGTTALAWNYFTLDNLYSESSLYASYGRGIFEKDHPNKLYAGGSLKYLNRSLGPVGVAKNALGPTGIATGEQDPVLQSASKSNMDIDLGLLYRPKPRWTVGLMIQHFLEPNIAFSDSDTDALGRNVKLGGSYKTPFSTLAGDVGLVKAPDGSTDKTVAVAAEKWLPTLVHGTFGVRGSLAVGSRSFRQVATGLSYRIHRLQFDYGFTIPLGGLTGTYGTHRLGLTFRFGRPREAAPTLSEAILENLRELAQVGTPEFRYQMEDLALFKRTAIEEFLRQAKVDASAGRFADALDKLREAEALKPGDAKLAESSARLKVVSEAYPEVRDFATDPASAALYEGILEFLIGRDREAVRKLAYAQTLRPKDEKSELLLQAVEAKAGLRREAPIAAPVVAEPGAPVPAPIPSQVAGKLALIEVALREREYDKVVELGAQVIALDGANALAHRRMGTAYYALKKYPEALKALRSAYKFEADPEARKSLRSYIDALTVLIERKAKESAAAKAEPAKPAARTPQEIERLYEAGVDLYAQGRLSEAATMFKKILELEPANVSARRALDRIQAEILQGQRR